MIQRKQTLFLILAVVLAAVCLSMPVGMLEPQGMGAMTALWNFGTVAPDGSVQYGSWPLFALLAVTVPMELAAIFLFRNRKLQAKLCTWSIVFCLAWYVYYAFAYFSGSAAGTTFRVAFAACLPLAAVIALVLARKGIVADEKLVRAADRIR